MSQYTAAKTAFERTRAHATASSMWAHQTTGPTRNAHNHAAVEHLAMADGHLTQMQGLASPQQTQDTRWWKLVHGIDLVQFMCAKTLDEVLSGLDCAGDGPRQQQDADFLRVNALGVRVGEAAQVEDQPAMRSYLTCVWVHNGGMARG